MRHNSPLPFRGLDVRSLGQVWTPEHIVSFMCDLCLNQGSLLEPACGPGAFLSRLHQDALGIEVDADLITDPRVKQMDFFALPLSKKFDTIIGNPPYVRYQDITQDTRKLLHSDLLNKRSNLYLYFIEKSIRHLKEGGELIFITPREFINLTSAAPLNEWIYQQGTITHFFDLGDKALFGDYSPNCAVWRFEKDNFTRHSNDQKTFRVINGQVFFLRSTYDFSFNHLFTIKVGAVSGADDIFTHNELGNVDFVCSHTARSGSTRRMIYNTYHPLLEDHKQTLINRRVRKFDDSNWWQWGRSYYNSTAPRIYINTKTRNPAPFFVHPSPAYDGSLLACFPHQPNSLEKLCTDLNTRVNWQELGFVCDGRYLFSQRSLTHAPLPDCFESYA